MQTLALNYVPDAEAGSARGGSKDDFSILSIELGKIISDDQFNQTVLFKILYYKTMRLVVQFTKMVL